MVMCPKQKQNTNWSQVEIENLIVRGRNLPRTNSTKCETQIIFAKKQENEHTPGEGQKGKLLPSSIGYVRNVRHNKMATEGRLMHPVGSSVSFTYCEVIRTFWAGFLL